MVMTMVQILEPFLHGSISEADWPVRTMTTGGPAVDTNVFYSFFRCQMNWLICFSTSTLLKIFSDILLNPNIKASQMKKLTISQPLSQFCAQNLHFHTLTSHIVNYNCNCPWDLGDVIFLLVLGLPCIHFVAAAVVKNGYWEWRAAAGGRSLAPFFRWGIFASREFAYYLGTHSTWDILKKFWIFSTHLYCHLQKSKVCKSFLWRATLHLMRSEKIWSSEKCRTVDTLCLKNY